MWQGGIHSRAGDQGFDFSENLFEGSALDDRTQLATQTDQVPTLGFNVELNRIPYITASTGSHRITSPETSSVVSLLRGHALVLYAFSAIWNLLLHPQR